MIKALCEDCCKNLSKVSGILIRMTPTSDKDNSLKQKREGLFELCYNHMIKFPSHLMARNIILYLEDRKRELQRPIEYALSDNKMTELIGKLQKKYSKAVNEFFHEYDNKDFKMTLIFRLAELELTYLDCEPRLNKMKEERELQDILCELKEARTIHSIVIKTKDKKGVEKRHAFKSEAFISQFIRQVINNYTITPDKILLREYSTAFQELHKKLPMYMVNEIIRTMSEFHLLADDDNGVFIQEDVCINIYSLLVKVLPDDFLSAKCKYIKTRRSGDHYTKNAKAVYIRKLIKPEVRESLKDIKSYAKGLVSYLP